MNASCDLDNPRHKHLSQSISQSLVEACSGCWMDSGRSQNGFISSLRQRSSFNPHTCRHLLVAKVVLVSHSRPQSKAFCKENSPIEHLNAEEACRKKLKDGDQPFLRPDCASDR